MKTVPGITAHKLNGELWREYHFGNVIYRIDFPVALFIKTGGTTHRVLDEDGIIHIVPAVGHFGCVLRVRPVDDDNVVQF